jgi:lipid A oxidase
MRKLPFLVGICCLLPAAAHGEFQISVYGGANTANDSEVTIDESGGLSDSFDVDWFGDSFNSPPYYGVRGTYWLTDFNRPRWGVALDFTHAKVKADLDDDDIPAEISRLEFTDGLNSVTLNALYRIPLADRFTVYAGAGAGASVPHVELTTASSETFEYQVTGPVVQALAGASVHVWRGFSVFGEYKASYSWNEAELDGGGSLESDILTHQFAIGASFSFGGPPPPPAP